MKVSCSKFYLARLSYDSKINLKPWLVLTSINFEEVKIENSHYISF